MGLDMSIYKTAKGEKIDWEDWEELEEVAYWRKFNALHGWFVRHLADGVDNCEDVIIPKDKLEYLLGVLEDVNKHPRSAKRLLPTESGFYFGDTEYDEYYYEDVKNSIPMIRSILADTDFETEDLYYSASW